LVLLRLYSPASPYFSTSGKTRKLRAPQIPNVLRRRRGTSWSPRGGGKTQSFAPNTKNAASIDFTGQTQMQFPSARQRHTKPAILTMPRKMFDIESSIAVARF